MIGIENIHKTYGRGEAAVRALNGASLSIQEGEMLAIIGRSGSGKSTLLHVLAGIIRPEVGEYRFDGVDVLRMEYNALLRFRRENIGIVMQGYALLEDADAFDNIALPLRIVRGRSQRQIKESVQAIAEKLGIADKLDRNVRQLSGGQRQRVAIARALVHKPRLLLADEPTGALHRADEALVMEQLKAIHAGGTTLVIVTHNEDVSGACGRCVEIDDGVVRPAGNS